MTPNHTKIQSPRPFSPIRLGVRFFATKPKKNTGRPKRKNWLPIEKRPFAGDNMPFFGNNMPFSGRETASHYQRNGLSLLEHGITPSTY